MSELSVQHLSKIYAPGKTNEVRALDDVSFTLEEGTFAVILGPSGAGKSTLLNILGGMDNPSSGSYFLNGREVAHLKPGELGEFRRTEIGFIFQFYNLMPNLTALENVELAEAVAKNPLDSKEVLASVGLGDRKRNFPSQLSGGEQQRVAIARALVKNPSLLLCDEPTGALDSKTGADVLRLLFDVSKSRRKTVLIVTHNSKIADCAEVVLHIKDGKLDSIVRNERPTPPEEIDW